MSERTYTADDIAREEAAGIPAIGIEQSEAYCEMAVERLTQTSLFEAGNAGYHQQVSMFEAAV